jgi:microsomal dipeptidase-like Zn-dependent dipeptidase
MTASSRPATREYPFDIELSASQRERANRLHNELVTWNACDSTPREWADGEFIRQLAASGITAMNHTVCYSVNFKEGMRDIAAWTRLYDSHPEATFVARKYSDIAKAKETGRMAVFMGFQDITALEGDLSLLQVFHALGIRWVQPTYQDRNLAGDGCGERYQSGLSNWGIKLVEECDRLNIVLDVSHVGVGTTLDTIEVSKHPVMATHSCARTLVDTPRNKTDEEIKALARKGGLIGIAGKSGFLKRDGLQAGSEVSDMVTHVEYVRDLVGIEHVAIGTDVGDVRKYSVEAMRAFHSKHPEVAIIGPDLKVDRMHPRGIAPGTLYNLTAGLVQRGFSDQDIKLVMGENMNRVLRQIWGDA